MAEISIGLKEDQSYKSSLPKAYESDTVTYYEGSQPVKRKITDRGLITDLAVVAKDKSCRVVITAGKDKTIINPNISDQVRSPKEIVTIQEALDKFSIFEKKRIGKELRIRKLTYQDIKKEAEDIPLEKDVTITLADGKTVELIAQSSQPRKAHVNDKEAKAANADQPVKAPTAVTAPVPVPPYTQLQPAVAAPTPPLESAREVSDTREKRKTAKATKVTKYSQLSPAAKRPLDFAVSQITYFADKNRVPVMIGNMTVAGSARSSEVVDALLGGGRKAADIEKIGVMLGQVKAEDIPNIASIDLLNGPQVSLDNMIVKKQAVQLSAAVPQPQLNEEQTVKEAFDRTMDMLEVPADKRAEVEASGKLPLAYVPASVSQTLLKVVNVDRNDCIEAYEAVKLNDSLRNYASYKKTDAKNAEKAFKEAPSFQYVNYGRVNDAAAAIQKEATKDGKISVDSIVNVLGPSVKDQAKTAIMKAFGAEITDSAAQLEESSAAVVCRFVAALPYGAIFSEDKQTEYFGYVISKRYNGEDIVEYLTGKKAALPVVSAPETAVGPDGTTHVNLKGKKAFEGATMAADKSPKKDLPVSKYHEAQAIYLSKQENRFEELKRKIENGLELSDQEKQEFLTMLKEYPAQRDNTTDNSKVVDVLIFAVKNRAKIGEDEVKEQVGQYAGRLIKDKVGEGTSQRDLFQTSESELLNLKNLVEVYSAEIGESKGIPIPVIGGNVDKESIDGKIAKIIQNDIYQQFEVYLKNKRLSNGDAVYAAYYRFCLSDDNVKAGMGLDKRRMYVLKMRDIFLKNRDSRAFWTSFQSLCRDRFPGMEKIRDFASADKWLDENVKIDK